uniref:Lipase_3 domain-containing protein n=1 Tax=Bursaphelenchus xylophilus TaxID=6326 RepID=A0A1I7RKW6_BURXY
MRALFLLLVINLFTSESLSNHTNYEEGLAEFALDFAAAAYAVDPAKCIRKHGLSILIQAKVACDYAYDQCWAFVAYNDSIVVTAIRGTQTKLQLITELVETMSAPKRPFPSGGSVQRYFYIAVKSLWKQGFGEKLKKLAEQKDKVTSDRIFLITFGQPRVGNMDYGAGHDSLVPQSWRLIHRYDIVAHLPYCYESLWSRQCSGLYNHGPYHHGTEIWYPESMGGTSNYLPLYRICNGTPQNEDQICSNSAYIHYNVADHLLYFNKTVSDYGEAGCPA